MTTGIIYLAKNTISNKCYVGQTTRTLEQRKKEHLKNTIKEGYKFGKALRKYPEASWEWSILAEVPLEELNDYERFFIKDLDSFKKGYNCNAGGAWKDEGNPKHDSTIYELWHPEYGEIRETISDLCKRHNSFAKHFSGLLTGKRQHINGYVLLKNKEDYNDIFKVHSFYHPDYGVVVSSANDLFKNYRESFKSENCQLYNIIYERSYLCFGWCLAKYKNCYKDLVDKSEYITLTHSEHGTLTLKRSEWKRQYGIVDSGMTYLLNGRYKSSRGWSLVKETI